MSKDQTWLLPEYIEDVLPPVAHAIEALRRSLLDHFQGCGYELVIPPLLEHAASLGATGDDLELATFRVVDELSGRSLGIRADHTPQVTRIDSHLLNRPGVTRLCYCGPVLHTRPAGLSKSREPLQIGAELYGYAGVAADCEIIGLLAQSLAMTGVAGLHIEIGQPGVFNALAAAAPLTEAQRKTLFEAIETRDVGGVEAACGDINAKWVKAFTSLVQLNGRFDQLGKVRSQMKALALPALDDALATLASLGDALTHSVAQQQLPVTFGFDLAELGGFHYEQGIVFAAYAPGLPDAIARGGRYDEVGKAFGRARPATGFTLDLKQLARLVPAAKPRATILAPTAPAQEAASFYALLAQLRHAGEAVIQSLPNEAGAESTNAIRTVQFKDSRWQVVTQ